MPRGRAITIHALLYASRAQVSGAEAEAAVNDIVRCSRARNAQLGITGALLFSGAHFAQFLEGSSAAVAALMLSIGRDPRHRDLCVLREGPAPGRRFADWTLAYSGSTSFVDSTIARTLAEAPTGPGAGATLLRLLEEFASD